MIIQKFHAYISVTVSSAGKRKYLYYSSPNRSLVNTSLGITGSQSHFWTNVCDQDNGRLWLVRFESHSSPWNWGSVQGATTVLCKPWRLKWVERVFSRRKGEIFLPGQREWMVCCHKTFKQHYTLDSDFSLIMCVLVEVGWSGKEKERRHRQVSKVTRSLKKCLISL